jgi:hypothetical protein
VIKKGEDPQAVIEKILSRKAEFPFIIRLESTKKRFFGKLADTLKVVCQDSNLILKYAKALLKKGWDLSLGDKIGYVIVAGLGKLYEKAKPYVFASYDEIDTEYYVSKQILPVASRILGMFGTKEDQLLPAKTTRTTITEFA